MRTERLARAASLFLVRLVRRPASSVGDEFGGSFDVQLRFNVGSVRIHRLRT